MRPVVVSILCFIAIMLASVSWAQIPSASLNQIETLVKARFEKRGGVVILLDLKNDKSYFFGGTQWLDQALEPGSLLKLATAFYFVDHGLDLEKYRYPCEGHGKWNGKKYYCWKQDGHGRVGLTQALALSCNLYFISLADRIKKPQWLSGLKEQQLIVQSLQPGAYPRLLFIGEGGMLGVQVRDFIPWLKWLAGHLADPKYHEILQGMLEAVEYGTGQEAKVPGLTIWGKTGTVESDNPLYAHAGFFIGFTKVDQLSVALLVMVEDSHGFQLPAKLAGEIFEALLH